MLIGAAILLLLVFVAFADRLGWITGKPVIDAGYFGAILLILLIMLLFCVTLEWRLACPAPDKWVNLECLKDSEIWKSF